MMMATRNDIKDRLIHNQSPYPTKDKVLSYTIPVDHSESLLFCSGVASTSSSQDNGSLSFITSEEDPCNGRDSLASFLDEGLGTSLDGVDEISSPIFPTLGRNDSGIFSSDEGAAGGIIVGSSGTSANSTHNHPAPTPHANLIPPPISSSTSTCSTISSGSANIISVGEVVSWKSCQSGASGNSSGGILLSPGQTTTTTISVVTDSATGIPSIICSSTPTNSNSGSGVPTVKLETRQSPPTTGKGSPQQQQQKCKSMPLGRQGPQKCTICDKVFSNASALTKHKLTHSDERRHACATCGKAFKRQDHLNGHMLTHRNKKPFECKSKGCGKSYCDARSLRRHVENRHGHDVLESMNLTSHHHSKHSNKNNNHSHNQNNNNNNNHHPHHHHEPPQPELAPTVTFTPVVKCEPQQVPERNSKSNKMLDCMPVLQPEQPQLLEASSEKATAQPPILQKCGESNINTASNIQIQSASGATTTLPIVLKRENVSVFDFDESIEDTPHIGVTFPHQDKLVSSLSNATIKVSNVIDSSKLGPLPDIRLIQEWTKRLGDSKVALFLASSSAASSLTQFAGPMASIQLAADGQPSAMSAGSAAFIPTSENGLFSVTPISLVPTSSGEFTFKPATISVPNSDSPKSLYIVPSEPVLSTLPPPPPPTISVTTALPLPPSSIVSCSSSLPSVNITTAVTNNCSSPTQIVVPKQQDLHHHHHPVQKKESKASKNEKKSAIGQSLANRIKTKLKAGSLKKLGKSSDASNKSQSGGHGVSKQTSSIVISKPSEENGPRLALQQQQQLPLSGGNGIPTISITAGGISWCESPKECHNGTGSAMEEDRLSESGVEGEDKPVECSICCRRFKNTPALNGHMRLHGGYFKKESEGSKKKDQVSKEPTHSTPLQTASVSVRALIEEKIKERRNNLLKLAAATAEKAANEGTLSSSISSSSEASHHQTTTPVQSSKSKSHSEKAPAPSLVIATTGDSSTDGKSLVTQQQQQQQPLPISAPTIIAQQSKLIGETLKLKIEPNTSLMEKDRNCDQDTNDFSRNIILNGNNSSDNIINISSSNNSRSNGSASAPTMVLDPSFHELDILIGDSSNMVGGRVINGSHQDLLTPQLLQSTSSSSNGGGFPFDKTNFTFLDCDLNADDLCQAFHLIYVDNNNGADMPLTMDQETLGKVSKMFQDPISDLSSLGVSLGDNSQSIMKQEVMEPVVCLPHDDPCNLPWEWRNSTSSENTENSFGNVQDCVNSLLCSSSSDMPDESSTKDPVAGGGYCYTPILSPNSTFCLTPGPDSPFETTSHSLSFISPSPTMGNGSGFSDPSSNLGNASMSSDALFSIDQPSLQTVNISMSSSTTPSSMGPTEEDTLQKFSQVTQQMDAPLYISSFNELNLTHGDPKQGLISISHFAPQQLPQQISTALPNGNPLECLPPINIFSKITPSSSNSNNNDLYKLGSNYNIFTDGKEPIFHFPMSNNLFQQQNSFIPSYELFAPLPLPQKVSEKWMSGKVEKNKKISVGTEYQAEIPNYRASKGRIKAYKSMDEKLWDPTILDTCTFVEVDKYLEFACCSAVPGGGTNKEYALHLLTLSRGNIREALLRLMEKVPSLPAKLRSYSYLENQRWSSEEIMTFQISLVQTGKDFSRISKAIGTKNQAESVCFYYFWKKACVNEYQAMKQIWRDRITLQQSQKSQIHIVNNNNQNHVSFLVSPSSQQLRGICK